MSKSHKRGGAKMHRKRVKARNERIKQEIRSIEHLKLKIFEEAKQRYEQEQASGVKLNLNSDV